MSIQLAAMDVAAATPAAVNVAANAINASDLFLLLVVVFVGFDSWSNLSP